jgi:penicillin-binding protein 2
MSRPYLAIGRLLAVVCAAACIAPGQVVNSALQSAVARAMQGQHGTAVVVDVSSGKVIASSHLDIAARRVAAPGSSIKPFTLLALLQAGKVTGQTALSCKRTVSVAGHSLNCSHPRTAEPLKPEQALAYSCNSYFTTVALRLSPTALQRDFVQDGFASPTGLAPEEAVGSVALADSSDELQLQTIGEWGIKVTPLAMAGGYRSLALLQRKSDPVLQPLFDGLEQSVIYGMGRIAQPPSPMKVAGKTGTSPAEDGAWTHAWFAGYAPANEPKIALVVFLEKGHGGSEAAAVAQKIFAAYATTAGARQ